MNFLRMSRSTLLIAVTTELFWRLISSLTTTLNTLQSFTDLSLQRVAIMTHLYAWVI